MTDTRRNPLKNLEQTAHDIAAHLKTVTSEEYLSVYTIAKDDYQAQNAWFWRRLVYAYWRTRSATLNETLATIQNLKQAETNDIAEKPIELENNAINASAPGILSKIWNYFWGTAENQPIKPEIEQTSVQSEIEELSYDENFLNKSVLQLDAIQDTSHLLNTAKTKQLSFIQITANLLKDGGWEETSFNTNLTRGLVKKLPGYDENIHLSIDAINLMKDSILIELANSLQEEVDDKEKKYEQSVLEQSQLQEVILNESGIHQLKMSLIPNGEALQTTETDQSNEEIEFQKLKLKLDLLEQEKMERDEKIRLLEEDLDAAKKTLNSLRSEIEAKKQNAIAVNMAKEDSEALRKKELEERNDEVKDVTKGFKFGNVKNELEKLFSNYKIESLKKEKIEEAKKVCGANENKNDIKSKLNDLFAAKNQDSNQKPLTEKIVISNDGATPKNSPEKLVRVNKPSIENEIQPKITPEGNTTRPKSTNASFEKLRQKMEKNIKLGAIPTHVMNSRKEKESEEDKLLSMEQEIVAQTPPDMEPEQSWLLQSTIFKPGQLSWSQSILKNENDEIECVSTVNKL